MLKWFYKWLDNKISDSRYSDEDGSVLASNGTGRPKKRSNQLSVRESDDLHSEPIAFKMYKASGGWAIEFRQYDHKQDRHNTSLYVVNNEEELGKHISQIITMEALRR
jgi:hypothetical protein